MDIEQVVKIALEALEEVRESKDLSNRLDAYDVGIYSDAIDFLRENKLVTVDKVMASFKEMLEGKGWEA